MSATGKERERRRQIIDLYYDLELSLVLLYINVDKKILQLKFGENR